MKTHRIFSAVALAMLWGGHAFASRPAYSYVTTGPGNQVLKINNSLRTVTSIYTANAANVSRLADATLFADGKLYVGVTGTSAASSNIVAIDPNTNGSALFTSAIAPKELRFSAYGVLFCNGNGGVRRVTSVVDGCVDPVTAGSPGSGLAFSANGSLIAFVNGVLTKVTLDANGRSKSITTITSALSGVTSIGVAAGGAATATGFTPDDILIATPTAAVVQSAFYHAGSAPGGHRPARSSFCHHQQAKLLDWTPLVQ